MAFSFELGLVISTERYGAILAEPEHGQTWTEIRSVTNSGLTGCKVGVIACNSTSSTPFTFSDFTLDGVAVPFAAAALEPAISNVTASTSGSTAQLSYNFAVDDDAAEGASVVRWYASETEDGVGHPVADGTDKILPLSESLVGKYVWAQVAPVDALGRIGAPVTSTRCLVTELTYEASDATLRKLELGASLAPDFAPDVLNYTAAVPQSVDTLTVSAVANNPKSTVELQLDGQTISGDLTLTKESHVVTVKVTAPDSTSKTYTVNLRAAADSRAVLTGMTLGDLDFDPAEHYYQLLCQDGVESLNLSLSAPGCALTVRYRNEVVSDGSDSVEKLELPLGGGINTLEVTVTSPDGKSQSLYRVSLIQIPSHDASLTSLTVNGNAVPGFAPETLSYKLEVTGDSASIAAAANHSDAKVAILADGKPVTGGEVPLTGDLTTVTVRVTAEDGSTQNYTLHLVKSREDNADLLRVTLNGDSYAFDPQTTAYSLTLHSKAVAVSMEALEKDAALYLETETAQARGIGSVSANFTLDDGDNLLKAVVTAPDGKTTKTYAWTITVERAVYLSDLTWSSANAGDSTWNGGQPAKDVAWGGTPLELADEDGNAVRFEKGIGTHADSTIVYDLTGSDYATFTAKVGVSYAKYNSKDDPQLIFSVWGDGEKLYQSDVMSSTTPYVPISVDISGVKTLTLQVKTNKDNVWSAHGSWADAMLLMSAEEIPARYAVTVEGEHAWTDRKLAAEGDTVTIFLEEGMAVQTIAVKGVSGADVAVEPVEGGKAYRFTMPAEAVTITVTPAEIPEDLVTITLDPNGGTVTPNTITITRGETTVLFTPYRAGSYRFLGWFDKDGKQHTAFTPIYEDVTLIAHWQYTGGSKPVTPVEPVKPVEPSEPEGYTDVAVGQWYYEAVSYVTEEGLMTGVGNEKFNPDGAVTRAMVWTVLARMAGETTDGGATWYSKAQSWAMRTGVSDGTNPMNSITREQLAAMLYRFEGSPAVSGNLNAYPDANTVSDWAKDAMVWATEEGIINGMNGYLKPQDGATRAQLAAMLMRFVEEQ